MTQIKICGITNEPDALQCLRYGADALGFVFADSPRRVSPAQARKIVTACGPFVTAVGVFVNRPVEEVKQTLEATGCTLAQLHGDEPEHYLQALSPFGAIKAIRVGDHLDVAAITRYKEARAILLDTYVAGVAGGTGRQFDPALAAELVQGGWRVILAGGLTPENVGEVVARARPYAVDVSSGVEREPGRKDPDKIARFVAAVRAADRRD